MPSARDSNRPMSSDSVWRRAQRREHFDAGSRVITAAMVRALVQGGGFVHPLFTDPEYARSRGIGAAPLPGQALLLLMGGLLETSGAFSTGVRSLVGYRDVAFTRRVVAGDELGLGVDLLGTDTSDESGLGIVIARLTASVAGDPACTAVALHLVGIDDG